MEKNKKLSYEVKTAVRQGVTRDLPHGPKDLQWVSNSATLIYGERDAVLVDTFTSITAIAHINPKEKTEKKKAF